ncbi:MAG: helix-turn-helix transcriptional regulator [Saprospiraceae bacterium]
MTSQSLTSKIFKFIELKFFAEKRDLLDEISKVLHIHRSSVYKKINGETSISIEEAEILCRHFRISLDEILGLVDDKIYFDFPALYGSVSNEFEFLEPIKKDLEKLYRLNPTIYYATKELPLFYYFSSPRLVAFKFHVFYNFVWRKDNHSWLKFDYNKYESDAEFKSLVYEIQELYSTMNSVELWNASVLDNTLNQIKYFLDSGLMIDSQESLLICDDIIKLVDRIELAIKNQNKNSFRKSTIGTGSFALYNNEIAHTNNVIFVNSKTRDAVYCTYDNPNFMRSISTTLCEYTSNWFKRLINNATPVTGGSLKDQNQFINRLREKIIRTRNTIESSLLNLEI